MPIKEILNRILSETDFTFKEVANQITIYNKLSNTNGKYNLSGFISDKESKEKLIGARLYFPELKIWCHSNSYGFYSIELPTGTHRVIADYIGMKKNIQNIAVSSNLKRNFELNQDTLILEVIDVGDSQKEAVVKKSEVAIGLDKITIDPHLLELIPSSNGLPDVTKYIQNIAGIQPRQDGSSAFQVRGLSNGNNLILLDEIPIYHPNHLLGIHSIINANAVKSINLYKDYIPSSFGLRNSSVLQIYTKEGNMNKFHASGGIGANLPHLNVEGPIVKNKASFYISGRRSSYGTSVSQRFFPSDLPLPIFYDLTVKLNYKINYNNRIYLTSYIGNDKIETSDGASYSWGNKAFAFRWNKILSDKMFTNLSVINSIFNYNSEQGLNFGQRIFSSQVKYDLSYFKSNKTKINFGASVLNTRTQSDKQLQEQIFLNRNSYETGFYASVRQKLYPKLTLNAGIRLPLHYHIGLQDTSNFLKPDFSNETVIYQKNRLYDFKVSVDPRVLLAYQLNPSNSFQLSAIIATQFTHILNYNTRVLPVQIWVNPSRILRPQRNYQTSLGWHTKFKNYSLSSIGYLRHVRNIIDFANVNAANVSSIESRLLQGNMNSFGGEFSLQYQKTKKYSAKMSYAYNNSLQTISGINNGAPYAPDYTTPHYFSFNQYFIKNKKWEFGFNFTFHSKTTITLPTSTAEVNETQIPIYSGKKNKSFLPSHDRLDVSMKRTLGIKKQKNHGYLLFTISNFYNSQNISNAYPEYLFDNSIFIAQQNFIPFTGFLYYTIKF
ncbi:MAG: TonB-dependent receptor [Crocinitomicaceae bacterium]